MDSELTLVTSTRPTPYFLSSTDLTDATIHSRPGVPLYRVTTDVKHITICGGTTLDHVIAVLHRRDLLPDRISFPHRHGAGDASTSAGTQMSLSRWLRRSKASNGTPVFTVDTEYGSLVWKTISRYRHKVFAEYDLEHPIASCYLHEPLPPGNPAFILESAGQPFRDDIVVAYLIQRYRVSVESKALALFVGPS